MDMRGEDAGNWSVGHHGMLEYRVTWGSGLHEYQHCRPWLEGRLLPVRQPLAIPPFPVNWQTTIDRLELLVVGTNDCL